MENVTPPSPTTNYDYQYYYHNTYRMLTVLASKLVEGNLIMETKARIAIWICDPVLSCKWFIWWEIPSSSWENLPWLALVGIRPSLKIWGISSSGLSCTPPAPLPTCFHLTEVAELPVNYYIRQQSEPRDKLALFWNNFYLQNLWFPDLQCNRNAASTWRIWGGVAHIWKPIPPGRACFHFQRRWTTFRFLIIGDQSFFSHMFWCIIALQIYWTIWWPSHNMVKLMHQILVTQNSLQGNEI